MQIIVMQGVPGAGKSTVAQQIKEQVHAVIVSSDLFHTDDKGNYNYKTELAGKAHAWCFRKFIDLLADHRPYYDTIIVDNTNTTVAEVAPYMAIAAAYEADAYILRVPCDWEVAAARTIHGVPKHVVELLQQRLDRFASEAPGWWSLKVYDEKEEQRCEGCGAEVASRESNTDRGGLGSVRCSIRKDGNVCCSHLPPKG
jgi:predicted kinase